MSKIPKWDYLSLYIKKPDTDGFTLLGQIPKKPVNLSAGRIPKMNDEIKEDGILEFEAFLNPDPETEKKKEELLKLIYKDVEKRISDKVWAFVEEALRTRVRPPIKGEITSGKIRHRGLRFLYGEDNDFIGIIQRNKTIYCVDGNTYDITNYNYEKSGKIQVSLERSHC